MPHQLIDYLSILITASILILILAACAAPLPVESPVISPSNAVNLKQIARWGNGLFLNVAWLPGGKTLAVSSSTGVYLYDAETLNEVRFIDAGMWVANFSLSPDGRRIALLGIDRCDETSDLERLQAGAIFPLQTTEICGEPMQVWDVETGQLLYALDTIGYVVNIAFSPDGRLLATSGSYGCRPSRGCIGYGVRLWDAHTGQF